MGSRMALSLILSLGAKLPPPTISGDSEIPLMIGLRTILYLSETQSEVSGHLRIEKWVEAGISIGQHVCNNLGRGDYLCPNIQVRAEL